MYGLLNFLHSLFVAWWFVLRSYLKTFFMSKAKMQLEILLLTSQVALFQGDLQSGKRSKPKSTRPYRMIWVFFSRLFDNWEQFQMIYLRKTVVGWHKTAFRIYWTRKSRKKGRPPISADNIRLIREIHSLNPLWSPERIHQQLVLMNIEDPPAPNTIRKYMKVRKTPPSQRQRESLSRFYTKCAKDIWAIDFFTVPTLTFKILYVLVLIHHETREIIHIAATQSPNLFWVNQQFRNVTPFGKTPKYLVHDNDPVFTSPVFQKLLRDSNVKAIRTSPKSPWQNPYAERVIGSIRRELLDYVIPMNERHLEKMLQEYVSKYYNPHRTHQGLGGATPIPHPAYPPTKMADTTLVATPVLNGLYHTLEKAS